MPLGAPSLPLARNSLPLLQPYTNSVSCLLGRHAWNRSILWQGVIRSFSSNRPNFSLVVTAAASSPSSSFRSPESLSPVRLLAEQAFAQHSRNEAVHRSDDFRNGAESQDNVTTSWFSLRKVARILAILLLGFGALFALRFPASANPETGASGARVARTVNKPQFLGILTTSWAGLAAGCLHALTGPDHLAALAPLCIGRARSESALIGALWGCGHDAGQVLFGLAFLLLKGKLHIELVRTWGARVVGVTLLAIGAVGLKEAQEVPVSVPAGEGPSNSTDSGVVDESMKKTRLRTFGTGIVYGLQPDSLIMILPALAFTSRLAGAAYLIMFLIGTVIAMGGYTAFIATCGQALEKRLPSITRRLTVGSSLVAIAFGLGVLLGEFFGIYLF